MILDEVLQSTRERVAEAKRKSSTRVMDRLRGGNHVIAEIKPASPSLGTIRENVDAVAIAGAYLANGASILSVLTEPTYFKGSLTSLARIRHAYPSALLLQKDFILDEFQLAEAKAHGADLVLLIVAALSDEALHRLYRFARALDLVPIVEVHDAEEMRRANALEPQLIGVNNRNLKTMEISLETSKRLAGLAGAQSFLISESGITEGHQMKMLSSFGYRGFLVGTSLMKTPDPGLALKALLTEAR